MLKLEIREEREPVWTEVDIVKVKRLRKLRKEHGEKTVPGKDCVARLRAQHSKLNPGTEWAKIDHKSKGVAESD